MVCIYHNRDLDGWCSGAIVKHKYPHCKMVGYDYGEPLEPLFKQVLMGEMVIMVDISLPIESMKRMSDICMGHFVWIDHHASAIKEFLSSELWLKASLSKDTPNEHYRLYETQRMRAVLKDDLSACEITWLYLFDGIKIPLAIETLGIYDTWRNQNKEHWENIVLPFQFGMRAVCNSVETFPEYFLKYEELHHEAFEIMIDTGNGILKFISKINEVNCQKNSFQMDFMGIRAICLCGGPFNSDTFKSVYDESKHDVMMPFSFNGKFWTVSLYTTKGNIDCSELAKKMGGGGHKKAAGFQIGNINSLFKLQ